MVFHDIGCITDVISGHRTIVYYVAGKLESNSKEELLCKHLDLTLEMLEKKNDDLLIIKILEDTHQFKQFYTLYKPAINGVVTLFIVNNEGIPIVCKHLSHEDIIVEVIQSICTACNLNTIPNIEYIKNTSKYTVLSNNHESKVQMANSNANLPTETKRNLMKSDNFNETSIIQSDPRTIKSNIMEEIIPATTITTTHETSNNLITRLQIRLPNGNKDTQEFKTGVTLKEVWEFISSTHKLKTFDLKTYNHQIFSEDEYLKTLQELDLFPNGVIYVVYKNVVINNYDRGISAVIQNSVALLMDKTASLFFYVHGLLLMFWNNFFSTNSGNRPRQRENNSSPSSNDQSSKPAYKKSKSTFGNVHTLHRNEDSDDENNRYNGNSTQQK